MNKRTLLFNALILAGLTLTACPVNNETGYFKLENWINEYYCNDSKLRPETYENALVIPVQFDGSTRDNALYNYDYFFVDFSEQELQNLQNYYFGKDNSLAKYFENASHGKKTFTGAIAPVYHETETRIRDIENDKTYTRLFTFLNKVVKSTQAAMGADFVSKYDKNNDGFVDCVNFITNYRPGDTDSVFWPHNYWTNGEKSDTSLTVFNYLVASTVRLVPTNKTIIHEMSHMFGVIDYYSYSSGAADYVGGFDLQDVSYGDWNAFSKFSVGWGTPYVVDGKNNSVTIEIGSNQETGEYVVIPADYSKYNNSPFDEYFIVELISNTKNNASDLDQFIEDFGPRWDKKYGVRISHVNAEKSLIDEKVSEGGAYVQKQAIRTKADFDSALAVIASDGFEDNRIMFNCNNSSYADSHEYVKGYGDNPLLSVVQKGGINTFAKTSNSYRHDLASADLFYKGDTFTFEKYCNFLTKDGSEQTKMNLGSKFPYTITFDEVDANHAKMTITK